MPVEDAQRWDRRYQEDERYAQAQHPRPFLLASRPYLPLVGLALDAPVGLGANAGWLLAQGLRVVGVDISGVAVRRARQAYPLLMAVQADLARFHLPALTFDVILNFYYLQRDLWPAYQRALKPGGLLIFETLMRDMLTIQPDIDPDYLLAPGELLEAFAGFEILTYDEGWEHSSRGNPRARASLLARKPLHDM